jgi:hypothetical protein
MSQNIAPVENPNEVACRTRCAAEQRASEMAEAAAVEAKARAELDKLSNSVAAKGSIKGRASAAAAALAEATRALSVATAEKAKVVAQQTVMVGRMAGQGVRGATAAAAHSYLMAARLLAEKVRVAGEALRRGPAMGGRRKTRGHRKNSRRTRRR